MPPPQPAKELNLPSAVNERCREGTSSVLLLEDKRSKSEA
jgi:hypothetical protein